ncbi:MAG: hypothetical protein R2825_01760 [Saprospiraceae bacterium]
MEVALVRDEVSITNVPYSGMVSDDVGYVNLTTFTREAGRNVANALKDLKVEQPNLKRYNPRSTRQRRWFAGRSGQLIQCFCS